MLIEYNCSKILGRLAFFCFIWTTARSSNARLFLTYKLQPSKNQVRCVQKRISRNMWRCAYMARGDRALSIIPLGGVGEIGKNMFVYEYDEDLILVDAGVMFPDDDMLGIDLVIPDISYLKENRDRLRGVFLTHGHEDHIGAVPYVLREIPEVPIYGTRLTLGLLESKLMEFGMAEDATLICVQAGDQVQVGSWFTVEFIHVNHSIPDVVAIAVTTPEGVVIHCSDFKFDQTPIDGKVADYHRLAELGKEGVLAVLSDSTNAERPGYTLSERALTETFNDIFRKAEGRVLVATFASNVHRIQQVIDASIKFDRKIGLVGRSMVNVVTIAKNLGYLNLPEEILIDIGEVDDYPPQQLTIITTGSQGEPMSALTRMAMSNHRQLEIYPGDTVVVSANPIPGNEKMIGRTIDYLFRQGAEVIYHSVSGVHVSGHASQEELKLLLNLCRPKYFFPIHGEHRMLFTHARLGMSVGIPPDNIVIMDKGEVWQIKDGVLQKAGQVKCDPVYVDGLGVGDVGNIVLRDRQQLSQDGILVVVVTIDRQTGTVVAGPDIITRGFVYVRESEKFLEEIQQRATDIMQRCTLNGILEWGPIKEEIRSDLSQYLYGRIKRRPMILPIIMEV